MSIAVSNIIKSSIGAKYMSVFNVDLDDDYPTGGYSLKPVTYGLSQMVDTDGDVFIIPSQYGGYSFAYDYSTQKLLVYVISGDALTIAGTNGTSAVTGTGTFTGTAPVGDLNIGTPAFSGTGQSSSGQVITTTDNQTMTLNQCAGMWFVSATHGPYLIASNTAVSGAPAVLTIYGTAPTTDAGTYKILKALTPVGAVSALSGTAAAQTWSGTASGTIAQDEVSNGTDLSALTGLTMVAIGL